jgi:hypothetical protein
MLSAKGFQARHPNIFIYIALPNFTHALILLSLQNFRNPPNATLFPFSPRVRVLLLLFSPSSPLFPPKEWRGTEAGAEATVLAAGAEPRHVAASDTKKSLAIATVTAGRTETVAHLLLLACSFAISPSTLGLFYFFYFFNLFFFFFSCLFNCSEFQISWLYLSSNLNSKKKLK